MVSKNEIKLITSLTQKKYRFKHLLFVAEGEKLVKDLLNSAFELKQIYISEIEEFDVEAHLIKQVSEKEMQKMSNLVTPSSVLGLFHIPVKKEIAPTGLQLVLDDIKDPGNLGTIIRLCDWFGVTQIVCSLDTVDCYNPKVVQATMGSIANVTVSYLDIEAYLKSSNLPKYFTLLEGENLYEQNLPKDAIIVMGNEANGIRKDIMELTDYHITIPKFSTNTKAESLNVAMATAVILSEFRR